MFKTVATELAELVIVALGDVERFNEIGLRRVFRDDRIIVVGVFPLHPQRGEGFETVYALIKKTKDLNDQKASFLLPRVSSEDDWAIVLHSSEHSYYYRPGLWEKHLRVVLDTHNRKVSVIQGLNGVPIDDDGVFPEFL